MRNLGGRPSRGDRDGDKGNRKKVLDNFYDEVVEKKVDKRKLRKDIKVARTVTKRKATHSSEDEDDLVVDSSAIIDDESEFTGRRSSRLATKPPPKKLKLDESDEEDQSDADDELDPADEDDDGEYDPLAPEKPKKMRVENNPLVGDLNATLKSIAKDERGFGGSGRLDGHYPADMAQRVPRDKSGERVQQLLQQIGTKLIKMAVAALKNNDFEVQGLYVPGDAATSILLLSGNAASTVEYLGRTFGSLKDAAIKDFNGEENERRKYSKLKHVAQDDLDKGRPAKIIGDEEADSEIAQLVGLVRQAKGWSTVDVNGAAAVLKAGAGGVYLVTPENNTHAELTLMLAVVRSGRTGVQAYLQGSKRPCTGCWLATKYAKDNFALGGITSGVRPGKLFGRAPVTGLVDIALEESYSGIKPYNTKGELNEEEIDPMEWSTFSDGLKQWVRDNFPGVLNVSMVAGKRDPGYDSESDSGEDD